MFINKVHTKAKHFYDYLKGEPKMNKLWGICDGNQPTSINVDFAIDDENKTIHIIINGDLISDYKSFGKDLVEHVQTFIREALERGLYYENNNNT